MRTINTYTNFNLNDLRTGDLVICKKGKKATVMKNTGREDVLRFHTKENSFLRINANYNDDLTSKKSEGFDIVRVYRAIDMPTNKIGDLVFNPGAMIEHGTVVYDRATTGVEIRTGDLLIHRNGKRSTAFVGTEFGDITRYHTDFNSFSYLSRWDDNMKHESNSNFDIVAIYRVANPDPTTFADSFCNPEIMEIGANLIWKETVDAVDDDTDGGCDFDDMSDEDRNAISGALNNMAAAISGLQAAIRG